MFTYIFHSWISCAELFHSLKITHKWSGFPEFRKFPSKWKHWTTYRILGRWAWIRIGRWSYPFWIGYWDRWTGLQHPQEWLNQSEPGIKKIIFFFFNSSLRTSRQLHALACDFKFSSFWPHSCHFSQQKIFFYLLSTFLICGLYYHFF